MHLLPMQIYDSTLKNKTSCCPCHRRPAAADVAAYSGCSIHFECTCPGRVLLSQFLLLLLSLSLLLPSMLPLLFHTSPAAAVVAASAAAAATPPAAAAAAATLPAAPPCPLATAAYAAETRSSARIAVDGRSKSRIERFSTKYKIQN